MSNSPHFARVVALLRSGDELVTSNDDIDEEALFFRVVLDIGSDDNIEKGTRFIIYSYGQELFSSDGKESLGFFEIVRGEGAVEQVQPKMCVVRSSRTRQERRRKGIFATLPEADYELVTVAAPFRDPVIGDFARLI